MTKSAQDIFNEKVSLIYEYNKKTPLFVRAANIELSNNNLEKCIDIIIEGLQNFPQYAAAYFVLGKAQMFSGDYNSADESFEIGSSLIGSKKTYEYYQREIAAVKKQRSIFDGQKRMNFLNQEELNFIDEEKKEVKKESVDDKLNIIAEEISSKKIIKKENSVDNEIPLKDDSKIIPSETLAKIYTNQNQINEAIGVYQELLKQQPEREAYFLSKIALLKNKL